MAKTSWPSLEVLVDQLAKRRNLDPSVPPSPPYHEFDTWKEVVQEQLLEALRYYLKNYRDVVSRAFQERLKVVVDVSPQRDPQPHYDPLPDKVFFALIEHDAKWLADPVIQCQIKNWQWLLKASPRKLAALRKKLKAIGECLVPVEVRGAGNFKKTEEVVGKMYFGVQGAFGDKVPGVYDMFKDLEQKYRALPGIEHNPEIRRGALLRKLLEDQKWRKILIPGVSEGWTDMIEKFARMAPPLTPEQRESETIAFWTQEPTPEQRNEALDFLKKWLPRRGRSASTLACQYIADKKNLSVETVKNIVKKGQ